MKIKQIYIRKDKLKGYIYGIPSLLLLDMLTMLFAVNKKYIYVGILQMLFLAICFVTLKSLMTAYKLKTKKCSCCGSEYDIRFSHCPGCGLNVSESTLPVGGSLQTQITEDIRIYKKSQQDFLQDDRADIFEIDCNDENPKDAITNFTSEISVETDFFREMED